MEFRLEDKELQHLVKEAAVSNRMYAEKYGVQIKYKQPSDSFKVKVDPDRLMQVLNNLISNACKFSNTGKDVLISIEKVKNMVRVSVCNYGPEIPLEFRPRIFQKFSQADSSDTRGKSGTGLGLNISRAIIEKLEGRINFTSAPEKTIFYFDLPLIESKRLADLKELITPAVKQKLLICEDDEDQSNYLQALLESGGYDSDVAHTVKDAKNY